MKVTKKDLISDIRNFPIEIVQKMCECQVEQGNVFSPEIFQFNRHAEKSMGGFDWYATDEGHDYWDSIIDEEMFHLFEADSNPSTVYLVYYSTGNVHYNTQHEIFVTKDFGSAQRYADRFNSILNKWKTIYSEYTHIDHGVVTLKKEFKTKDKRWNALNETLWCKIKTLEFRS